MTPDELKAALLKVEGSRPDTLGISTYWYCNPEGPEAVKYIEALEAENAKLRAERDALREQVELDRNTFRDADIIDDPIGVAVVMQSAYQRCEALLRRCNNGSR
jgi:hypothetical protein